MPDNTYTIRIELPKDGDKKSAVASAGSAPAANSGAGATNGSNDADAGAQSAVRAAKRIVSYGTMVAVAEPFINHTVDTIILRTGATEFEQKQQFIKREAMQGVNSIAAIVGGAMIGGAPGAVVATVGVAASYASKALNWYFAADTIRMKDDLEGITLSMARTRMGTVGSRGTRQ